ncbi:MAG TPA: hypothetical protein VN700_00540 [Vicinamibacterales bacterium]|nr:hypothetical protein [Vicinamibacterales bacterium]
MSADSLGAEAVHDRESSNHSRSVASAQDAAGEYHSRLQKLQAARTRLEGHEAIFSFARLGVFAAGAILALTVWSGGAASWTLLAPATAFGVLVLLHDRLIRRRDGLTRSIDFYERGLARLEDRWAGNGEPGDRFADDQHLYANDLDLFGRGSLFELLSAARTRAGEETLADWLLRPATPDEIAERQHAVAELTSALDVRETLALASADVRAAVHTEVLVGWAERPQGMGARWWRAIAILLTTTAVATGGYWIITGNYLPLALVALVEILFYLPQHSRVLRALLSAEGSVRDLDVLAHVLGVLERTSFTAPRLVALRARLNTGGIPASAAIRRLHRLIELCDWQRNALFAPVAAVLLWVVHLVWAIEDWRAVHGPHVRVWLQTVGEFEALSSLAAYRYEHPADVWPEIVGGPAQFEATALGHPLIPSARMVRNDVHLSADRQLQVVSGSNMSGKSTLLRTVGINAVLALAGAPVRAARLRLTPVAIGATLRIEDSLQQGRSRFFAEIVRIRALADLSLGPKPLLFLIDELFHGTNSHDRLQGGAGVLRSLLARGAIGLITTHDLALTAIADQLPRAFNAHFEDQFKDGEMHFDFQIRPGPVTRSNAIALMRVVGLDVDS